MAKTKLRDDQILAQALCDWAIKNKLPPKNLKTMVQKHLHVGQDAYLAATNLGHMAHGLWVGLHPKKPAEACTMLRENVYKFDFTKVFRTVFEGLSVSYSGYNSLPATTMLLRGPDAVTREMAREFLRWDYTIQALCSTIHGRVVMPCGRVYATNNGVYSAATDYRQRAIQGITHDGWWPPKGVGPKFWADASSVSARPWKEIPALPEMVFSIEERAALRKWVTEREITRELRALLEPIKVYQTLHVAAVDGGHVAWMESIQSYGAGNNTAQVLVWARGDEIEDAWVTDPPIGCTWDGETYVVHSASDSVSVVGFPEPGRPHISIGPNGPVFHDKHNLETVTVTETVYVAQPKGAATMPDQPVLANYDPKAMSGQPTSGVGYKTKFTGRPDPWPNNQAVKPNSVLRQTYIDRYGVPPGTPSAQYQPGDVLNDGTLITEPTDAPNKVIGYSGELFTVNGIMLKNKAIEGVFGPGLDAAEPTLTEMTDAMYTIPQRSNEAKHDWWEAAVSGGMQSTAIPVSKTDKPAGYYTEPGNPHPWPIYYLNVVDEGEPGPDKNLLPTQAMKDTAKIMHQWIPENRPKQKQRTKEVGDFVVSLPTRPE